MVSYFLQLQEEYRRRTIASYKEGDKIRIRCNCQHCKGKIIDGVVQVYEKRRLVQDKSNIYFLDEKTTEIMNRAEGVDFLTAVRSYKRFRRASGHVIYTIHLGILCIDPDYYHCPGIDDILATDWIEV